MFKKSVLFGLSLPRVLAFSLLFALFAQPAAAQGRSLIRDAEIEATIRDYATPIFQAAGLSPRAVNVYLIRDPSLNAFVSGGLRMFIHTGLLIRAEGPLQVIGVMAHETGHIIGGHIVGRIQELRNAQIKSLLTYVLGIGAAVASGRPEAGAAITLGGQDVALKGLLSFTRGQEQAADQTAVRLLKATGQSPEGLLDFFEILSGQEALLSSNQDPYLRTHPLTSDRVLFLEQAVQESPYANQPASPDLVAKHNRMRAKLIGFLETPRIVERNYPKDDTSLPARYAWAISHYRQGRLDQALEMVDALIEEYPDDPYFQELKGQILFENGRVDEALPVYQKAVALLPDAPLLQLNLSQVMIELNRPELDQEALEYLNYVVQREPDNSFAWRLLAIAHGRQGDKGMTALALSERALILGRLGEANQQAKRAQQFLAEYSPAWLRAQDVENLSKRLQDKKKN